MRKVIRVNPKTHMMCIPNEIAEDGLVGDVPSYPNAVTLTLVVPGATLEDVDASLERTLADIRHRIKFAGRKAVDQPKPLTTDDKDDFTLMRERIIKAKQGVIT